MIDILPIRLLTQEDIPIFGPLPVSLGKLERAGLQVGKGIAVALLDFKLRTIMEHFDFGTKEIFEQSLSLVKKEIYSQQVPEILLKETKAQKKFYISMDEQIIDSQRKLWEKLLDAWILEIKRRLWRDGFYPGITQNLPAQVVIFIKKIESSGISFFDPILDDTVINIKSGKPHPNELKKIDELVRLANKKLFMPFEYEWIVDAGLKLVGLKPYTPVFPEMYLPGSSSHTRTGRGPLDQWFGLGRQARSTIKVILDLSTGFTIEKDVDGVYIASEKIFDLNKPQDSFEDLVYKTVEASITFPSSPVFFKLADMSEGMGKVRGSLRLLHQKSLFDPLLEALNFIRHKKGLLNVHIVIPFVRGVGELLQVKRELATKKLMRKNSLQIWMEAAIPENIINIEDYLETGIDGVIINLDELAAYFGGFDHIQQELTFYKKEVKGLTRFLEDGLKLLHKSKVPFISYGSLNLYPEVLDFLVEKGVYGIILERYEAPSAKELLHQVEKRLILRKNS